MFAEQVLKDIGTWCRISTTRDFETVAGRFEHEGLEFLSITLPTFGKDLERGLDQGFVDHTMFAGFGKHGATPRFLGGLLDLVFDRGTGRLVDEPSVAAIRAIRQFTLMWAKIEIPCSDERRDSAMKSYIDCDKEVITYDENRSPLLTERFARLAGILWDRPLSAVGNIAYSGGLLPRHGSGSTADRLGGNAKYNQREWTQRLEEYFPYGEYCLPSWSFYHELHQVTFLEPGSERPVRVISVPKTLKTPRIIAIEPTCMQYAQQALLVDLVEALAEDDISAWLIGIKDQTPNQRMAREGSLNGTLATLDLSEASDRVSNQLVQTLFGHHPFLNGAVQACRSKTADVPGHGIITLAKFASMGSALCFPVEAMVFATAVFLGIEDELRRPLTRRDVMSFKGKVRVYGDDIIVPVEYMRSAIASLEALGLKVNAGKSFGNGMFRESCGKDYYSGVDVSIVRLRQELPKSRKHVSEIVGTVALRNHMFHFGFDRAVDFLDSLLERLIPFPEGGPNSPLLVRHTHGPIKAERMHPTLQHPLVRGAKVRYVIPLDHLEGHGALMKYFLGAVGRHPSREFSPDYGLPTVDREHLERAGRPVSARDRKSVV